MDWADKSKLQIEKWLISARWYYSAAVLLIAGLPWLTSYTPEAFRQTIDSVSGDLLSSLQPAQFPLLSLFVVCLLVNAVLDVWRHVLERNWKLLKPISSSLATLSSLQVIFDLTWISLAIYFGQISPTVYPLFYFIPIVESIILFSLWGPILVAILSAGLVTILSVILRYFGEAGGLVSVREISGRLTEVLTPSIAVTIIYLVIGFFGAYLSGVVRERGELLARENSLHESSEKAGRERDQKTKFQEQKMSASELELSIANQKLRELDDARSRFVAVTTHEMRTPLAGIKWTLNMLNSGELGELSDDAKEFIKKGMDSTDHLIKIVSDLINIDKVDTDSDVIHPESLNLVELISDVTNEFSNQAVSRNIHLTFVKPEWGVPLITADRKKLRVVFENLIDNAIKYTKTGGRVTIMIIGDRLNTAEPQLEITVADSGIGINPHDRDKIFHKFYRGAGAIQVEPDGTGVGLYLSRDIIERHRGTIWYESRPNEGTIFHFTLPVSQKKV